MRLTVFAACVVLALLAGCTEPGLLDVDPATYRNMDSTERAKYITNLWQRCKEGVEQWKNLRDSVPPVGREERIEVLEEARPYGEQGFKLAPNTAHQCTYWYAWCLTFLGWEYKGWSTEIQNRPGGGEGAAKEYEDRARYYLRQAVGVLLHYERVYYDTHPNPKIYEYLEANYELLGDRRSAYIVANKYLGILLTTQRQGVATVSLEQEIERWRQVVAKLRQQLIDNLEPIPEVDAELTSP